MALTNRAFLAAAIPNHSPMPLLLPSAHDARSAKLLTCGIVSKARPVRLLPGAASATRRAPLARLFECLLLAIHDQAAALGPRLIAAKVARSRVLQDIEDRIAGDALAYGHRLRDGAHLRPPAADAARR